MFTGLADMVRSVEGMIFRAVVAYVNNTPKVQTVRVGDEADDAEHWQPLGLRAVPRQGAEALVVYLGGDAELPAVLAVVDRRDTPPALAEGEVAVYAGDGQAVVLKPSTIELGDGATLKVARVGDTVEIALKAGDLGVDGTGALNPLAPVTITGTITSGSDVVRAL